jgi:hypothetical protein
MIQSFGGRVVGSISGKTNILVVGKEPGYSMVVQARQSNRVRLISLQDLADSLRQGLVQIGQSALAICPTVEIEQFSSGWHGNSKASSASAQELEYAKRGDGRHLSHSNANRSKAIMGTPSASPAAYRARATPGSIVPQKFTTNTPAKGSMPIWADYEALGWKRLTSPSRPGQVMYKAPDGTRHKTLPPLKVPAPAMNAGLPRPSGAGSEPDLKRKAGIASTKTFLHVKYEDKDQVKRLGARFDGQEKNWYVLPGKNLEPFAKWLVSHDNPAKRYKM